MSTSDPVAQFPGATQYPVRWWGYPSVHAPRRIKPTVLLVVHITGNARLPSALGEAQYSNRDGSGASFTFVTNRNGTIIQCLDPITQTPWTNGDLNQPNLSLSTVKAMVGSNYNANEFCLASCENVGYEPGSPITDAQVETLARLAAWLSKISGLPMSRQTIIGHRDINSVTRHNCPTTGDLDTFLARIITRAKELSGTEDQVVIAELKTQVADLTAKVDYWKAEAQKRWKWILSLRAKRDELNAEVDSLEAQLSELENSLAADNVAALEVLVKKLRGRINTIKGKVAGMAADVADD